MHEFLLSFYYFAFLISFFYIICTFYIQLYQLKKYTAVTEPLVTPVLITHFSLFYIFEKNIFFFFFLKVFNIFQKLPLPLPDEENRIPDALDPVTHETSTKHNIPDAVPTKFTDSNTQSNDVHIMGQKQEERPTSFFGQPGILAGINID